MNSTANLSDRALLVILDGFGINPEDYHNAIKHAQKPNIDRLFQHYPMTTIEAGGVKVGLPKGVVGNSEVGHMNLGAGKPVRQDLVRINESIEQGTFSELPLLKDLKNVARRNGGRIHVMGLLSDGGVHSHINHIKEVIRALNKEGDLQIFFHAFMDGRDTAKDVGAKYIDELCQEPGFKFASMQGRSIGMDRDCRWEKIKKAYDTFTGFGHVEEISPKEYLLREYEQGRYDEFIEPVLFNEKFAMKKDDSVFMINFRPDRAIQMTLAMTDPNFKEFNRPFKPVYFLCMTPYIPDEVELPILFNKERVPGGLSEYLSELGKSQFKIAETEKYAHVTFFFNGGEKKPFPLEEQVLVPSPKEVKTYDEKPEMSAMEVTDKLLAALENKDYTFYLVNFANSDMVGHTGNFDAALKAIETLDICVGKLMEKCEEQDVTLLLTADHGNSDQMEYPDGKAHTSHTGAPVPFAIFHKKLKDQKGVINGEGHALMDVSPSILHVLGINAPATFEGHPIFK